MQVARGIVHGNTVTVYGNELTDYDEQEVTITLQKVYSHSENNKLKALNYLKSIRKLSDENIDCRKELAMARDKKYADID